jgi:hypothetical protein
LRTGLPRSIPFCTGPSATKWWLRQPQSTRPNVSVDRAWTA